MSNGQSAFESESANQRQQQRATEKFTEAAERLLGGLRSVLIGKPNPSKVRDLVLAQGAGEFGTGSLLNDVVETAADATMELVALESLGIPSPCLGSADGQSALISIKALVPRFRQLDIRRLWENPERPSVLSDEQVAQIRMIIEAEIERSEDVFASSFPVASEIFLAGVASFLGKRLGYLEGCEGVDYPEWLLPWDGGLKVKVSCQRKGLRLHCAPAYFIDWKVFGEGLSSPVWGSLAPGRYKFGWDFPGAGRIAMDKGTFEVPPDYHISLVEN